MLNLAQWEASWFDARWLVRDESSNERLVRQDFLGRGDESEICDEETTDSRVVENEKLTVIVIQNQRV